MEHRRPDLLDCSLGAADSEGGELPLGSRTVLVLDRVDISGSFIIHQIVKRTLLSETGAVVFLAFARPLIHYDRVFRKLGCNLTAHRKFQRFFSLELTKWDLNDSGAMATLYEQIHRSLQAFPGTFRNNITLVIDDVSMMEVAANGCSSSVSDFIHYCYTLTSEFGCTFIVLNHEDIYDEMDKPTLLCQMKLLADISIKVEPLSTGFASDVHGQISVLNRGFTGKNGSFEMKVSNFQFMVKENTVEYFYPGGNDGT